MDFVPREADVVEEIKSLQARIPGLRFHGSHQAVSTGPLLRGCDICTRMRYMSFQLGFRCNTRCPFCFLETHKADARGLNEGEIREAFLKEFHRRVDDLEGVALTGGEPLLYLPEMEAVVSEMRQAKPGLHFWTYSNALLADEEHLIKLRDIGVQEIRFNLAATNYSQNALSKVKLARGILEQVAVEVPCYPPQKERLMGCLAELDRIGIDQLNLQELLVTDANVHTLEGEGYQSGMLFAKRYFLYGSRKMTYEVMQHCVEQDYSFTINDCSASKFGAK